MMQVIFVSTAINLSIGQGLAQSVLATALRDNQTSKILHENQPEGFLWYNEVLEAPKEAEPETKQTKESAKTPTVTKSVWDRNIDHLKEEVEKSKRKALDNPTFENVLAAQRAQKEASEKSRAFAAMWKHVALVDSGIAANITHTNSLQKKIADKIESKKIAKDLKALSKHWALILEVEDSCSYCHSFAPIVKEFASNFGYQLIASSRNGRDFEGIQGVRNIGQLLQYNPQGVTPVLYLIHEGGKEVYPIARGITTEEEIIEHIYSIDKHERRLF